MIELRQFAIDFVDLCPDAAQIESAVHALDAQMIFFVHHQADLLGGVDHDAPRTAAIGQFAADQLALDQELSIDGIRVADIEILHRAGTGQLLDRAAQELFDFDSVVVAGLVHERKLGEIPCQPNPAAHDNIGLRSARPQPFAKSICQFP